MWSRELEGPAPSIVVVPSSTIETAPDPKHKIPKSKLRSLTLQRSDLRTCFRHRISDRPCELL